MGLNRDEHEVMRMNPPKFVPVAPYSKPGTVRGLKLPDGSMLMEMKGRSEYVLTLYSHTLDAEKFSISGTWTFTPDPETIRVDPHNTNPQRKKKL